MKSAKRIVFFTFLLSIAFLLDFEHAADTSNSLEARIAQATYLLKAYGYTDQQITQIIGPHN